ncbi:hypothetical protein ACS0TY_017405 [Phlomoides rotata]
MNKLFFLSDADCISNLRMDRNNFARLCFLTMELGGLVDHRYVSVEEQIFMFLSILTHHKKNRDIKFDYIRYGQTVSRYVHIVLKAILSLHTPFLMQPTPVPNNSTYPRCKWFKGCLGALHGTYIDLHVSSCDKPHFRTRKGRISTNVLGICDRNMRFVYVLPGWKGSAADCRVLCDAILRPNGLKVPKGNYYLGDNGYANSEDFLVPYRGFRYHLKEWGPSSQRPVNHQEHFNIRHTRARNMCFGILRSATFYPVKTQVRLIMTCFLLHNFFRSMTPIDPIEILMDAEILVYDVNEVEQVEVIDGVESSLEWNNYEKRCLYLCSINLSLDMMIRCAKEGSLHPGRYYYKCPVYGQHPGHFIWCDVYHQHDPADRVPPFLVEQTYNPD